MLWPSHLFCFLRRLYVWGSNLDDALALENGAQTDYTSPVFNANSLINIQAGLNFGCGFHEGLKCWGSNSNGRLGQGNDFTAASSAVPLSVSGFTGTVQSLAVGQSHACVTVSAPLVMCWGNNDQGQVGDDSQTQANAPVAATSSDVNVLVKLSAGGAHTCGITSAGAMFCWGANDFGQLGVGDDRPRALTMHSVDVSGAGSSAPVWEMLIASQRNTCGLADAMMLFCWGAGDLGMNGPNNLGILSKPTGAFYVVSGPIQLAGMGNTGYILTSGGSVFVWGDNRGGQAGLGDSADPTIPTPSAIVYSGAASVASGSEYACILMQNGTLQCFGFNEQGQLGLGDTATQSSPTTVPSGEGLYWSAISTGSVATYGRQLAAEVSPDSPVEASPSSPESGESPESLET